MTQYESSIFVMAVRDKLKLTPGSQELICSTLEKDDYESAVRYVIKRYIDCATRYFESLGDCNYEE